MSPLIYQRWTHSYEEDGSGFQVYRPQTYHFPPSRGRGGFELKEDGRFIDYPIGPTDRPQAMLGKWEVTTEHQIQISLEEPGSPSFTLELIEVQEDYIKVRKTFQ